MPENPVLIHAQQIKGSAFGDKRLEKRGRHFMMPSASISPCAFATSVPIGLNRWGIIAF